MRHSARQLAAKALVVAILGPRRPWWMAPAVLLAGVLLLVGTQSLGRLWVPMVGLFIAFVGALWMFTRRCQSYFLRTAADEIARRICPMCGYDLRGINGERCPECGENVRDFARSIRRSLRR